MFAFQACLFLVATKNLSSMKKTLKSDIFLVDDSAVQNLSNNNNKVTIGLGEKTLRKLINGAVKKFKLSDEGVS